MNSTTESFVAAGRAVSVWASSVCVLQLITIANSHNAHRICEAMMKIDGRLVLMGCSVYVCGSRCAVERLKKPKIFLANMGIFFETYMNVVDSPGNWSCTLLAAPQDILFSADSR